MEETKSEKVGVDQIEKAIDVLVEAGNAAEKVVAEKGSFVAKLTHLTLMSDELFQLAGFDFNAFKAQLKDLDSAEKAGLLERAKAKFNLENDKLEAKIEAGLDLLLEIESAVKTNIALVKKVAAFAKA